MAILATDQNDKIDPKLEAIAKEIQKTEPKLTGFHIAVMTKKTIAVGGKDDFDLGSDQSLRVAVQQKSDKEDRYQLKITPPQMGDITYQATGCGKFLPIITPVRTKNNECSSSACASSRAAASDGGGRAWKWPGRAGPRRPDFGMQEARRGRPRRTTSARSSWRSGRSRWRPTCSWSWRRSS